MKLFELSPGQTDQIFHKIFIKIHILICLHVVSWWSNKTNMSPNISLNIWIETFDQKVPVQSTRSCGVFTKAEMLGEMFV